MIDLPWTQEGEDNRCRQWEEAGEIRRRRLWLEEEVPRMYRLGEVVTLLLHW